MSDPSATAVATPSAAAPAVDSRSSPAPAASRVPGREWTAADRADEVRSWLEPRLWPVPAWTTGRLRRIGLPRYESHQLHRCRVRYLELETEFRTVFAGRAVEEGAADDAAADVVAGQCALGLLQGARRSLEHPDPDVPAVSATLDLVERCLLWATAAPLLAARVPGLRRRLDRELSDAERQRLSSLVRRLAALDGPAGRGVPLAELRSAMDEAIAELHVAAAERDGTAGLRLERLVAVRDRGLLLLGVLVALLPMFLPARVPEGAARFAMPFILRWIPVSASDAWLAGIAVALFGAAGGFASGLLRARPDLGDAAVQQEGVLRLELRAAVGALVGVVGFALLSWGILPGVSLTSAGTFLLLAFGGGFAERLILRRYEAAESHAAPAVRTAPAPAAGEPLAAPVLAASGNGHGNGNGNGRPNGGHPFGPKNGRVAASLADGRAGAP